MKVAYLLGSLNRGGAETLLLDVFKNASKAPFEMICIHRRGGAFLDEYYAAGPKMICCTPKRFGLLRYLWQLRQRLLRENISIVHAQQSIDCIYARLAAIGTGIRVVETIHSYDLGLGRYHKIIRKLSIYLADTVCFVSKAQKDYYIKNYRIKQLDKLHVAYNGIDFSKFDNINKDERMRGFEDERVKLCTVGNFVRGRSQKVIVKAIEVLKERGISDFDFYFIGRKDNAQAWRYDECVHFCEENQLTNVHFLGARSDVPSLLWQMDGFVYSSIHDTFGIAVVEAIAAGLPIVVNDWDVMKEVCGEENAGIRYFKTNDAADSADKIADLVSNLESSKKAAEANALRVREQYSIERHIQRLTDVYSD